MLELLFLMISAFVCLVLIFSLQKTFKNNETMPKLMEFIFGFLMIWCIGLIAQKVSMLLNLGIKPIYYDYITYFGICNVFPTLYLSGIKYSNPNKKISKKYALLYLIPVISLLILWTNDFHQLFYKVYSINFNETVYGLMFYVNSAYSYSLVLIFVIKMIKTSIKKSGFFSLQSILIILGSIIPMLVNMLGTLKIIDMSIYVTPMLFVVSFICNYIAIFKFKALNITPIAFRTIIDTMSDAYIVISNDGTIVEYNTTFKNKFKDIYDVTKASNLLISLNDLNLELKKDLEECVKETRKTGKIITKEYHFIREKFDKYFEIDVHPIAARDNSKDYVGTLLSLKDITQHKLDLAEIQEKQEVIVKQGQLVSIGELAGGVAHDINTPISAIKTGITMLNTIGERTDKEKEILQRMENCSNKIINIVNSMRNQIRNLGGNTNVKFNISTVVNDIKTITFHEVSKYQCEVVVDIKDDLSIKGDPTKFGQVLTNIIVNAAQAYGEKGGKIEVLVEKAPQNQVMVKITDYAGGISDELKQSIFKKILTTKGTSGTGLGLYLAYSVVVGEFNGNITFESEKGEGTTFYITIPQAA